ncbi:transmembrane protein 242-like [Liolophura sinensis]|uniref:transmembrane protein 242-like n=1 Tax=Liolophura sinensis TaxID=3198878 RepID=UPI003158ED38
MAASRDTELQTENLEITPQKDRKSSVVVGGMYLTTVTGFSLLFGFGMTVMMAKKRDPTMFTKSLLGSREIPESGGALALRALGWGTLYSVTGVGLLSLLVWKLLGVKSAEELREKMQTKFPQIPKNNPPGRSEFKTVRELVDYLIDEDSRGKKDEKT